MDFLKRSGKIKKEFLSYFVKVWLRPETCGWYQGFAKAIPDHNNSNETDNKYIKECQDRKRLGLIQFLNHAEINLISDSSKRRSDTSYSHIAFHSDPQLKLKDCRNAWQWCSLNKKILRYKDGRDLYCMPSGLETNLSSLTVR